MAGTAGSIDDRPGYGQGREALLEAAVHLVATSGLRNLTYRAVATRAGVTHGLVRHHFGSRDSLIAEALQYALRRSVETSSLDVGEGQLSDFASTLADMVATEPELQAFQFELVLESRRNPELRPHVEALYEHYRSATRQGLLRLGIEDENIADLAFAALDGLAFAQTAFGDRERTVAGVMALQKLLNAVASEQETKKILSK
ncbi:MAG: TetR family transcriptional regulator [Actinomycetes bacterium]